MRKFLIFWNNFWLWSALLFALVFFIWNQNKETIGALHDYILQDYVEDFEKPSHQALERLKKGNTDEAQNLLINWREYVKGDRAYPVKRQLLLALVKELYHQKQFENMLHWSEIWHGLDPRDVTATAYWMEALRHSEDRWQEGLEGLIRERMRFPGNPTLKRFSTPAAKSNEAFAKLIPRWWQVFWDTGRHFNPRESAHLLMTPLNDHEWKGLIRLPEGVKNLRIDPPGHIKIRLSRIRLEVNGYGFPISPDFMKFQMMIPGKSWVDTDGQFDPFFYFDVEKYFSGKPVDINFRVALSPTTHPAKGNQ